MTTGIDKQIIHCCDCGKNFVVSDIAASDITSSTIRCPYCNKNGTLGKECRR